MVWKLEYIKILGALLLGCVGFLCSGQGYFNKLYPYGPVTYNVIETRNGYGTIGAYTATPRQSLLIMEVDYSGNVIYTKVIDSLKGKFYVAFEGNLAEYPGGYGMAVHYRDTIDHEYLMFLDTNFRFRKFHEITGVDNRSFSKVIYHDGFFYITGHIFTNDYPDSLHRREALLMKVDTTGLVVYNHSYANSSYKANKVVNLWSHDVVPASDGGTYMAAWKYVDYLPGVNIKDSADFLIIKVDSNGIKEWEHRFGNPALRDPKVKLLPYSDSSILAFAAYPISSNLDYPDYNTSNENRVYEVYNDGRPMQLLKTFGPRNRFQGPFGVTYLKNGNICFYGLNRVYQMDINKYPGIVIGYTFVLSPQLDSLNLQYHQSVNNSITDEHFLLDARPTSDGGIIGGGYLSTDRSSLNNNLPGSIFGC